MNAKEERAALNDINMKKCTNPDCLKAGELQPLDNFYARNGRGRVSRCKVCVTLSHRAALGAPKIRNRLNVADIKRAEKKETDLFNSLNVAW